MTTIKPTKHLNMKDFYTAKNALEAALKDYGMALDHNAETETALEQANAAAGQADKEAAEAFEAIKDCAIANLGAPHNDAEKDEFDEYLKAYETAALKQGAASHRQQIAEEANNDAAALHRVAESTLAEARKKLEQATVQLAEEATK